MPKGARTRPRGPNADLYIPGQRRKMRAYAPTQGAATEVDPKVVAALKFGRQRAKKSAAYSKFLVQKKDTKRERRQRRAAERKVTGAAKQVPDTKENKRRPVLGMVESAADPEIRRDEQMDEFSAFYAQTRAPVSDDDHDDDDANATAAADGAAAPAAAASAAAAANDQDALDAEDDDAAARTKAEPRLQNPTILITTCKKPSYRTRVFAREATWLFPNSMYRPRRNYTLGEIIGYCTDEKFAFVVCIGERIKQPHEMIVCHLPEGPTATFRISSFVPASELEETAERTRHYPELNLKNFDTRLGRRVARILEALFPATRDYAGRAVATFHNQRDFIFVRVHRYVFDSLDEVRVQELGPRLTLRLMSLQKGTFDSQFGEYEWLRKKKHDEDKLEWYM
jgi:rRNA maturation protein Rpf1